MDRQSQQDDSTTGTSRRAFMRNAGLAGAAATAATATARAGQGWRPDPEGLQFTLAVQPDTQFLYFAPGIRPEPQKASFRYIVEGGGDDGAPSQNIVFMVRPGRQEPGQHRPQRAHRHPGPVRRP
ncbi:MAG: hypothetical protein ACRDRJ_54250 [Streptosporangiaceae bacterium]